MEQEIEEMSDAELLKMINPAFGTGLLGEFSVPELFNVVGEEQLSAVKGIGQAKTRVILAVRELVNRLIHRKSKEIKVMNAPEDVFTFFQDLARKPTEEIWVALLDVKNRILKSEMVAKGTVANSLTGMREIFNPAIKRMAAAVIVAHNHPSGLAEPSKEDIALTSRLIQAGEMLGIPVLDHVIIGTEGSISMRESQRSLFTKDIFKEVF